MAQTKQEWKIGDCVELMRDLPATSVDTIITSPPYWSLRDYGVDGQIGLEGTLEEYHARLLEVTAECMRALKPTGVMFWNHGDSYGGNQGRGTDKGNEHRQMISQRNNGDKCLAMQNERLIMRMIDDQGWILRNRIIWNKSNGMPSSVTDRFSNKYEPVYMLVKSKKYWFDLDAVRLPHTSPTGANTTPSSVVLDQDGINHRMRAGGHLLGKNPGDVWTIPTQPYPESHFATFPTALIEPMIKAACPVEICPVCGMARERIIDKEILSPRTINGVPNTARYGDADSRNPTIKPTSSLNWGETLHHTTGWTSCNCNAGWIAGTVLDPFCGSGTVLEVCRLLNRNAIGLELNPEYEPLIRDRSMANTPPLTSYFGDSQ